MTSHFALPQPLAKFGIGTSVVWSCAPSGTAVVFVHGFGGGALATWSRFASMLPMESKCNGMDLFFYGYDSLHTEVTSSAIDLRMFLTAMFESPANVFADSGLPMASRMHPVTYSRLLLVSHSLGAVVTRRAILDEFNGETASKWAPKIEFVFYAPAHQGAKILSLVAHSLFGGLLTVVPTAQLFRKYLTLHDLKEGSNTLKTLAKDLENTYKLPSAKNLRARRVVWANNDSVVVNSTLDPDPSPIKLENCDHSTVCKPNLLYPFPLNKFMDIL